MDKIKKYQMLVFRGRVSQQEALDLADSFDDTKVMPKWALALRALSEKCRLQHEVIQTLSKQLTNPKNMLE